MKLTALTLLLVTVAHAAPYSPPPNQMDMKEVEKLLAQIDAEEQKAQAQKDPTVNESWQKLLSSFRQMTTAYVGVLNAVNKSLGLPKYPTLPGLPGLSGRQSQPSTPAGIRQIQENLRQLQNSATEVGQLVRRVVSNMSQDSRQTVLSQFRKFTELWSNQLQDISGMLEQASRPNARQDQTLWGQINGYIRQVNKSITDFANNLVGGIRNRLGPVAQPQPEPTPAPAPAQP